MRLVDIKELVMFQTNNDADDLGDFMPHIDEYINDGYARMLEAYHKAKIDTPDYPRLTNDADTPKVPRRYHDALADWATWLIYRNGNAQKQSRGYQFRQAFDEVLRKMVSSGGAAHEDNPTASRFYNLP